MTNQHLLKPFCSTSAYLLGATTPLLKNFKLIKFVLRNNTVTVLSFFFKPTFLMFKRCSRSVLVFGSDLVPDVF